MVYEMAGVIPRAAKLIFERISQKKYISAEVSCSYLEIYNEDLCDLLAEDSDKSARLTICAGKNKKTQCFGLLQKTINKEEDILNVLHAAQEKRQIAETEMNKFSSRSHCLFTLTIKTQEQVCYELDRLPNTACYPDHNQILCSGQKPLAPKPR